MTIHSPARQLMDRAVEAFDYADVWQLPQGRAAAPLASAHRHEEAAEQVHPIDLVGLARAGFVRPGAAPNLLSEEVRIAKRPLLAAAFGPDATDRSRRLLVCSANPGDGKTFCAVNLAMSLAAERDTDVVLVDGDVAKPSITALLGLPDGPGLMDALIDGVPALDPLLLRTDVPNLSVLRAGRSVADATELLSSRRCADLLDGLGAPPRRIVVLDSPPLLAASPATALALHVGQVVMVVRADRTTEGELREAHALLPDGPRIHLLLNGVTLASGRTRYGSYYGEQR